jgi:hypothetical protein
MLPSIPPTIQMLSLWMRRQRRRQWRTQGPPVGLPAQLSSPLIIDASPPPPGPALSYYAPLLPDTLPLPSLVPIPLSSVTREDKISIPLLCCQRSCIIIVIVAFVDACIIFFDTLSSSHLSMLSCHHCSHRHSHYCHYCCCPQTLTTSKNLQ